MTTTLTTPDILTVDAHCERALTLYTRHTRRTYASALVLLRDGWQVPPGDYSAVNRWSTDADVRLPAQAKLPTDGQGNLIVFAGYGQLPLADLARDYVAQTCRYVKLRALVSADRRNEKRRAKGLTPLNLTGDGAVENAIAAIRSVCAFAIDEGLMSTNPALKQRKPNRSPSRRRPLTNTELLEVQSATLASMRDIELWMLMLAFFLQTGARRNAAVSLRLKDLDKPGLIRLVRKGGGFYEVPILPALATALLEHARVRGAHAPEDQVFRTGNIRTDTEFKPLTGRMVDRWCHNVQAQLDWDLKWTPHLLRHTLAAGLERVSRHQVVAAMLGHAPSAQNVTSQYGRAGHDEVRRVEALFLTQ